jgi:hypothetical protein
MLNKKKRKGLVGVIDVLSLDKGRFNGLSYEDEPSNMHLLCTPLIENLKFS